MAKRWTELEKSMSPESRRRVKRRLKKTLESMPLAEVRKALGLTQVELAQKLGIGQGTVSKMEHSTDMYISTLRRMVEALGGELSISVRFPGKTEYILDQFGADGSERQRRGA